MSVERLDDTTATVYLSSNGTRIRIPLALHRLLLKFQTAARPDAVCGTTDASSPAGRAIAQLVGKGFLVPSGAVEAVSARKLSDPPVRLFDVPAQKLMPAQADVVVVGMPWDFGDPRATGARRGPLALRDVSLQILYGLDRFTGRPLGWFDVDSRHATLAGVSITDAGDVIVNHGEARTAFFDRARDVIATLVHGLALPVVIGGDASTAYPVIEVLQNAGPLDVVRIGRHPDPVALDAVRLTAGSLPAHALSLPFVQRYIQVTPSGSVGADTALLDGYMCLAIDEALTAFRSASAASERPRVHLGLDVDALARASDAASGASFVYRDVRALLAAIGRAYRIVSVDLCGSNPADPCWGPVSMTALHLLLVALGAAKDPA